METHEKIKELREKRGMSQEALAFASGYKDRSSIAKIEAGLVDLTQTKIAAIAKALGVKPVELIFCDEYNDLPENVITLDVPNMKRVPILGRIACGKPIIAQEYIEGYVYTDLNGGHEYFALKAQGDSMNAARINDGDIVIIRRQDTVDNGQIAVVMVGDEDATLKRYRQDGRMITLSPQSTNPEHQPQIIDSKKTKVKVIGLAVSLSANLT